MKSRYLGKKISLLNQRKRATKAIFLPTQKLYRYSQNVVPEQTRPGRILRKLCTGTAKLLFRNKLYRYWKIGDPEQKSPVRICMKTDQRCTGTPKNPYRYRNSRNQNFAQNFRTTSQHPKLKPKTLEHPKTIPNSHKTHSRLVHIIMHH